MLQSLHVKNMALIREAEVEFGPGLNIMTGETGAGKSIMIGSVNIALGVGNFRDYVPDGADYALVELIFTTANPRVERLLGEMDLPSGDGEIIITRKYKSGRSTSKVNGETVPVSFVRRLAGELLDIHGQHEHQSLLDARNHLGILDAYAKAETGARLAVCREQYRTYLNAKREWEQARLSGSSREKELDFLQYEIREIESAGLRPGEDEELEASYRLMSNGQKIRDALSEAGSLTGAGGYSGAGDEIGRAVRIFGTVRGYDSSLDELGETLDGVEDLLGEFNRGLSDYMDSFVFDERELNDTAERLNLLNRLKSKYGRTIEEILASCEEKKKRAALLEDYETYLEGLQRRLGQSRRVLMETAEELSALRQRYAVQLSGEISAALQDLNFLDVRFETSFTRLSEPGETGIDEVEFRISMNPGMPLRPLAVVASGGELSRIMLAIKAVMADRDKVETLIFDEIDSGISGRTAQKVSEKMALIACSHQILCITHLAQIAAMADRHIIIEKIPADSRTVTRIGLLDEEQSVRELARILGGAKITDAVIENAREMKALAQQMKEAFIANG